MKKNILFILLIASFISYGKMRKVDSSQLLDKNGVSYVKREASPFTGMAIYNKDREFYANGKPNGKWLTFYENGKIKSIENWRNGFLNGKYVLYKEDGSKIFETSYLNGDDNGTFKLYHNNGRPHIVGYFVKGNPSGTWNYYDDKGKLIGVNNYGKKTNKFFDQKK